MLTHIPCLCGESSDKKWSTVSEIDIVECTKCGIRRVPQVDPDKYTSLYTSGTYHTTGSVDTPEESAKRGSHAARLQDDLGVAHQRLHKLWRYKTGGTLIDVGCANGAFMMAAEDNGFQAIGVDLSNCVEDETLRQHVHIGDLRHLGFQRRSVDVITFNDSFEHFINPMPALSAARGILKRDGILVIEVPDMGSKDAQEQGAAFKHVKPHEHLWYFTSGQLRDLLESNGFTVLGMDAPIPGKVTAYATPSVTVEEVEIHGPAGIGDAIWLMNKFKGIREAEWPCTIKYVICADMQHKLASRASDFLLLSDYVDSIEVRPLTLPPDVGCDDPSKPVYRLLANNYLDPKVPPYVGGNLADWHPELKTSWDIGIQIPRCAELQVFQRMRNENGDLRNYVCVYASSRVWNRGTLHGYWSVQDWAKLCIELNAAGLKPVLLGAEWDKEWGDKIAEEMVELGATPSKVWVNMTGKTPLLLALAFMKHAKCTFGITSGLPITGAQMGYPTIIAWPVAGVSNVDVTRPGQGFCKEFKRNWVPPDVEAAGTYKDLTVGEFTLDSVLAEILQTANVSTNN